MIEIPLTHGKVAVIDDVDAELSTAGWFAMKPTVGKHRRKSWYAVRTVPGGTTYLHREILGITDPTTQVDHRDGDGLNCQRNNLRVATPSQNGMNRGPSICNTCGYKGVSWHKKSQKWRATLRNKHLGLFDTKEEAAAAYDVAAFRLFGEFAYLNFSEVQS